MFSGKYAPPTSIVQYPQPRKSLQHVLWNHTSQCKRSATTPNRAWHCNTALPNVNAAVRRTFSHRQRAYFRSTSQWNAANATTYQKAPPIGRATKPHKRRDFDNWVYHPWSAWLEIPLSSFQKQDCIRYKRRMDFLNSWNSKNVACLLVNVFGIPKSLLIIAPPCAC